MNLLVVYRQIALYIDECIMGFGEERMCFRYEGRAQVLQKALGGNLSQELGSTSGEE